MLISGYFDHSIESFTKNPTYIRRGPIKHTSKMRTNCDLNPSVL